MKKNTWVFYFFIILFSAILSINLVWRFTPIRAELTATIQERINPYLGSSFTFSDFSVGFGYMVFYEITAGSERDRYFLKLDEIQIGYSIHKLLFNKFDPLKVIESITIKNPHLIILTESKEDSVSASKKPIDISEILTGLSKLGEIDRLLVSKGQFIWGKSLQDTQKLITDLDGYLIIVGDSTINLNLQGRLFESESRDLTLSGEISLTEDLLNIQADIIKGHLKKSIPFLNSYTFSLQEADISGQLFLTSASFDVSQIQLSGNILVKNMLASLFNQQLTIDDFYLYFDGQKMLLSPVSGRAEDGHFVLTGHLGEVFRPGPYFSIDIENYSAKNIAISAPILELLNQGKLQGHLEVEGPTSQIKITGLLYASQMNYSIVPFYRTTLDFIFSDKIWTFEDITTSAIGLQHKGKGYIDFNQMNMAVQFYSDRPVAPEVFPILDRLNNTRLKFFTDMTGDFATLTFLGTVTGGFFQKNKNIFTTTAGFELIEDHITVQNMLSTPAGLHLYSQVSNLWENPTFEILDIKNIPFDSLSSLAAVHWLHSHYHNDFYASGPVNFPSAKVNFKNRLNESVAFALTGNVANLIEPGLKLKGHFTFHTRPELIEGDFVLEKKMKDIILKLDVPAGILGEVKIGTGENAALTGSLDFKEIQVSHYLGKLDIISNAVQEGILRGEIQFNGTTALPLISFQIHGDDFIINKNGYYSARLKGIFNSSTLRIEEAGVTYNGRPVLKADLDWDFSTDWLNAAISGENFESNFIAATFLNDKNLIQGDLHYRMHLQGDARRPAIRGSLLMENGILKGRQFHTLQVDFQDSIPTPATLLQIDQHYFRIKKLQYIDKNDYTIEVAGIMPVSPASPMDLTLHASGNILTELPNFIDYFQKPVSLGEMYLYFTGTRETPKIEEGKISIYNGSLEFTSVIPPLRDLRAEIELRKGEQFIRIWNLEGKINNRFARIYNLDSVKVDDQLLMPWNFEEVGLNFGILVLETDKRGIPLSIPGLMNPGDIGFFATDGKLKSEKFYFAGPVEKPNVRGGVILNECRVTFPFLVDGETIAEPEDDIVLDFLMNINWDIQTVAGVGNRYFVDIPAVLGEVYLDLNIDNISQGLEFTGRLNDETFRVGGGVESTRGRVEYLDINFRVDRFGAIFNRFELYPEVYGRAYTTVRDSTNFPRDIYLVLYAMDPETNQEVSRGRWEDFRFKLISSDPTIVETQENVLAYMGYSIENLPSKASDVGLTLTDNLLIRPLVRPLERKMERGLKLDYVRLTLQVTSNLFYYGMQPRWKFLPETSYLRYNFNNTFDPALMLFQSSEISVGKYLLRDIYFSYSGQLVAVYEDPKFGINHRFGMEYRLLQNLLLEFEYDKYYFDPKYYRTDVFHDFRIRLKHSFNF